MKIAWCGFGIVGGSQGKDGAGGYIDFGACAETYKTNIFQDHDVDVFIHTWSVDQEKAIRRIYNPVDAIFEPQIKFNAGGGGWERERHLSMSRWYSTKQVLGLQAKHARDYDHVMICRFDIMWNVPLDFNALDRESLYIANWNEVPRGPHAKYTKSNRSYPEGKSKRYLDLWFIGQQKHMDKLASTYDNIEKIGNHEYDQHNLTYTMMSEFNPKFITYRGPDWELHRIQVGGRWK